MNSNEEAIHQGGVTGRVVADGNRACLALTLIRGMMALQAKPFRSHLYWRLNGL